MRQMYGAKQCVFTQGVLSNVISREIAEESLTRVVGRSHVVEAVLAEGLNL